MAIGTSWTYLGQKYLGSSGGDLYIRIYAKYSSQSATANQTYGVQYQARAYFSGSYIYDQQSSGSVGGTSASTVSYSKSSNYTQGETTLGTTSSVTINHNASGGASVTGWAYLNFPNWGWSGTASVSASLPSIDRSAPTVTQSASASSATTISISASSNVTCNLWQYSLDNGSWTTFSSASGTSASGTITVTEGTHTVRLAGRKSSNNVFGYGTTQTIDTTLPVVSATFDNIATDSFYLSATATLDCNLWEYSIDGGTNWVEFSTTDGTSASTTVTGLTVNTTYNVVIRAKRTANSLYSRNATYSVKTQGGIVHVNVNGSWKEALAYVKIGSAWKQAICYTKVGSSWRINT